MSYEQAREDFRDGDLVFFSKGKRNIVRRIITWFSNGPIYHVGIAFWMVIGESRRLMLAESQPGGFRIINLGFYRDRDMTVFRCPVPWGGIVSAVVEKTGTSYDFLDMALIGFHEKFGTPIPERFTGAGEVCSVIVAKILQEGGAAHLNAMVSPQRLYSQILLQQLPSVIVQT